MTQLDEAIETLLSESAENFRELEEKGLGKRNISVFESLSEQRQRQRRWLFRFAIFWSSISLLFLFVLIIINSRVRFLYGNDFALIGELELNVLSVAVFGQLIGVVTVIAKSLWDETPLKDMLKTDWKDKHKDE